MGVFDFIKKNEEKVVVDYKPNSEQEAWIAIFYSAMMADGDVSDIEINDMSRILTFKRLFVEYDTVELFRKTAVAYNKYGGMVLIEKSSELIAEENKPTLFASLLDLLLSDGVFEDKEVEIAEFIAKALKLEESIASKIIDVIFIKNKGNMVVVN